jgi:prefoldin alpha subunit
MEQEKKQELIFRLSMFEQQIRQVQEQIEAVENGITELGTLNFSLDELKKGNGKEIFSPIGRGIFIKSKIISDDLTVDIGGKNFVKKSIPETKEIIDDQIKKLIAIKEDLNINLEKIGEDMNNSLREFQSD